MSTAELKSNLCRLIDGISDHSVLSALYAILLRVPAQDGWDTLEDEQKAEIEEAMGQLDNGEGIPHEKVFSKFEGR
ncbi:MAG: hypothetical protein KDD36_04150 [Flavobacteriales bacterium]|nr:hypothetical protein [Flavobacteriales bacterium]